MKTLCLYVFHKLNERVYYFIKNALFYNKDVDFIIISNNTRITREELCIPDYCKFIVRENIGYDFGAWSAALFQDNIYVNYDYFIFANSSIIGPFVPSYYKGNWTDIYINGLNEDIKLFGSTINVSNFYGVNNPILYSHVQSYIFCINKDILDLLIKNKIFDNNEYCKTFNEAIDKEIGMSRIIINNGGNIGCLHEYYKGIDFRFKTKRPEDYGIKFLNDIMYQCYYNILWNKYEIVFVKGNRVKI